MIYIYGDLSNDVSLRGVTSIVIIKDTAIYAVVDGSSSASQQSIFSVDNSITGYNEANSSDPHATYSNGTLTIDMVENTTSAKFNSSITYSYKLIGGLTSSSPSEGTWETVFNGNTSLTADSPYPYWYITQLSDVSISADSRWRITIDGDEYTVTAANTGTQYGVGIGNPLYIGGQDDGSTMPSCFFNAGWGAWSGGADLSVGAHTLKIERLVT